LFSPKINIFSPLESTNGSESYTTLGGPNPNLPSPGVLIEYDSFILGVNGLGDDVWLDNGVETVAYNNGDYQAGGEQEFNLMVIPKTSTSSIVSVENMGWNSGTQFNLELSCPTTLPSFVGTSDSTSCVAVHDETFYFARFRNKSNTYPERNNPIFSDPNGENPVNNTNTALNISMNNGDVIQVKKGMVIGVSNCNT